ncbi:MAG: hypothetical protein KGY99_10535 [Phycisphaerae bacterium]|nr:hypothetical protein [Phycisphaerae bacterium]
MDEPLRARTINEAAYWLRVTPCAQCGGGPLLSRALSSVTPGEPVAIDAECAHCGVRRTYTFVCDHPVGGSGPEAETINPTDAPSDIIDVGQWISLFSLLIESGHSALGGATSRTAAATRLAGYRAALCLAEALKFYGDGELPPTDAFYGEQTLQSFRDHPESFTRQRLLDLRSKLPTLGTMARRIAQDRRPRRRWWPFGRRR